MIYSVYVLMDKSGRKYTGYTSRLDLRIKQHNTGITFTTRKDKDWKLIYKEEFNNKSDAIRRERFLKSVQGREYI